MLKNILIIIAISVAGFLGLEFVAGLVLDAPKPEPRYACARNAPTDSFKIFTYGGSTVYGTPTPSYGFVAQLKQTLLDQHPGAYTVCNMGEGGRDSSGVVLDLERTLEYEPNLVIVLTGHNEFLSPSFEATSSRRLRESLAQLDILRLVRKLMPKPDKKARRQQNILPEELPGYPRDSADFAARQARYEANLATIAELTSDADTPLLIGTLPSNTLDWPPTYRRVVASMGGVQDPQVHANIDAWFAAPDPDRLQLILKQLPADAPITAFFEAFDKSPVDAQALMQAKDQDAYPWRASSAFNTQVRSLPQSFDNTTLVDVEQMLLAHTEHGALGFDLISDNCHPTPEANFLITRQLLDAIAVHANQTTPYSSEAFQAYMDELGSPMMLEYLLDNARYVMKVPFFHYSASRMYLEKAQELNSEDWRIWANLASLDLLQGSVDSGKTNLRRAMSLAPDTDLLKQRRHAPYLEAALQASGLALADL